MAHTARWRRRQAAVVIGLAALLGVVGPRGVEASGIAVLAQGGAATQPAETGAAGGGEKGADGGGRVPDSPRTRMPDQIENLTIEQNVGTTLAMDTQLTTSAGKSVTLGRYFEGNDDKPIILNFAYYECPVLCSLIMENLAATVADLGWKPGEKFEIVTISVDPGETPSQARAAKADMLEKMPMQGAGEGWHFHTAAKDQVQPLAEQAGFPYRYLPEQDQYSHKPVVIMVSPSGKITEYLIGLQTAPGKLRDAIQAAAAGKQSQSKDIGFVQACWQAIKDTGYVSEAQGIMKLGGVLTMLVLFGTIGLLLVREGLRRRHGLPGETGRDG